MTWPEAFGPEARLLLGIYGVVLLAELPDKTAIASLVLATRYRPWVVFTGSAAALAVQSLIAVAIGSLLGLLPARPVHIVAGLLFFVFAFLMLRRHEEEEEAEEEAEVRRRAGHLRGIWVTFVVVFLAEWGDVSQLSTATFAAHYHQPLGVFLAATAALWTVVALAALLGARLGKALPTKWIQRGAALVFVLLGVALLAGKL